MTLILPRAAVRRAYTVAFVALCLTLAAFVAVPTQRVAAQDQPNVGDDGGEFDEEIWFRVVRQDGAPVKIQTSVVRYQGQYVADDGTQRKVVVDLIGAVHIAERQYYDKLNAIFQDYETVVYELVSNSDAPTREDLENEKNQKIRVGASPLGWVSLFQQGFGAALGLTYQMDGIDYGADNLRRGDCSPEELIIQTIANGDVAAFLLNAIVDAFFSGSSSNGDAMFVVMLCAQDRRLAARRLFALELEDSSLEEIQRETYALDDEEYEEEDDDALRLLDEDRESALIHFRNDKALDVVEEELDAGRTKLAVFYGAGHMPDLGAKLENEFELERAPEIRWITAWDMARSQTASQNVERDEHK